ncbi:hypothetical protein AURDEDRAFT_63078 [Auricularia subglabra TFB-10046 SS5]|nr:hypothetical protein AURDEDRAFT_63078 [Auricularia subglabra TFB-10046 SS5]
MGDPGSPLAFLLYLADFTTPAHPDDISIGGVTVAHLEHADDMVLLSTSPEGLQSKLDALAEWSSKNQMEINTRKTKIMIFPRPHAAPPPQSAFHIYGSPLETVKELCYVGVWLSTITGNLWDSHFTKTCQKARRTANISFFIESHTGSLPPWQGRSLYSAQISPHLTWATEVTGLGTLAQLGKLEAVQLAFLRRLLGVQKRSQRCILFTETGLWPLRFRRLDLQLRYLRYAVAQPEGHLARVALEEQYTLALEGRSCWLSEMRRHLYNAGVDLPVRPTAEIAENCLSLLKQTMLATIESEVLASPKLSILHHRVEYDAKGLASTLVMKFRPYLRIEDRAVRHALTRVLVSDHRLSVEILRRTSAERRYYIPRSARLCRFCMNAVEDPLHALFACYGSLELLQCRQEFWEQCDATLQDMRLAENCNRSRKHRLHAASLNDLQTMQPASLLFRLIGEEKTARVLGTFVLRAFEIFDKCERYVPDWDPEWKENDSGDE